MKFIIATGGSGGHIFPALRVAQELKAQGHKVVFLGSFDRVQQRMQDSGFPYEDHGARGLTFALRIEMITSMAVMIRAIMRALFSVNKIKPDVVLGFGGYGAFPVVLSAALLRYPALIHEQKNRETQLYVPALSVPERL